MTGFRWSDHALANLAERELDRAEVETTLAQPEAVVADPPNREVLMRRYFDRSLQRDMLLRVVVEDTATERVVVTVYRTSQIDRYLKGTIE